MTVDLEAVLRPYPSALATYVRGLIKGPEPISVQAWEIADRGGVDRNLAERLLADLADLGELSRSSIRRCSVCRSLVEGEEEREQCAECATPFVDNPPVAEEMFIRPGQATSDVRWMFTIHGMNTRGPWQQDFSWFVARAYGYAIPIFIYKYGRVRLSPFLELGHKRHMSRLRVDLKAKIAEMADAPLGDRPDIVAHSFGTYLLAHVLEQDPSIRVRRVILTGSIVHPGFDWDTLLARGQVEAVLCHSGGRDVWVRAAPFFIPETGPSGVYGFASSRGVTHANSADYRHSDFFAVKHLPGLVEGLWSSYLTSPDPRNWSPPDRFAAEPRPWSNSVAHRLGSGLKLAILGLFLVLLAGLSVSLLIGVICALRALS